MDTNQLITTQIDPCNLAATSGMLIAHSSEKDISKEFTHQVVHQLAIQGVDPDNVLKAAAKDMEVGLPMVSFQLPICVLMHVSDTLVDLTKTDAKASAVWLMKSWTPALLQVAGLLTGSVDDFTNHRLGGDRGPFDSMGRCMN